MQDINLITALTIYLFITFAISFVLRLRNYRAMIGLVLSLSSRWPKLMELTKQYRGILLRWPTLLPIICAALLMLLNTIASVVLWSQAKVTIGDLGDNFVAKLPIIVTGIVMLFLDLRGLFIVTKFDREAIERELDKAEHWLGSWKAPAVRILSFGLINPRRIVSEQVREAIINASAVLNGQVWRWALQVASRFAFGLAVWITWFNS